MVARSTTLLWAAGGFLSLLVIAIAAYQAWPVLFPQVHATAPLDAGCDLRAGPCTSRLPGGDARITFSIEPRAIPVVHPLRLRVELQGLDAQGVQVDFSGVDMTMGFNRPTLQPQGPDLYVGEGRLPVCVRNAMEWEARVLVQTGSRLVSAPYRFITVKPGMELPAAQ